MGLTRLSLGGTATEIGQGLGRAGYEAVHRCLLAHPLWAHVTGEAHAERVALMAANTRMRFPAIWAEITGLAQGLDLPVMQVFAWNCRGDLLASVPDGCTTILHPGETMVLAHNEDGFPFLRGHCLLVDLTPQDQPGLTSFAYPGSIPGHSFAITQAGLVQTVNNIRLTGVQPTIPRMVLGRAVLACKTLDEATKMLGRGTQAGGFHLALAQAGDARLLSVEYGRGGLSVQMVTTPMAHANHALHLPQAMGHQIITASSADRQRRSERLVAAGTPPLDILRDKAADGLPIRRDAPDDPDEENTIATLMARIGARGVDWTIHPADGAPISGHQAAGASGLR